MLRINEKGRMVWDAIDLIMPLRGFSLFLVLLLRD